MLNIGIDQKNTVDIPFIVERTCTDCNDTDDSTNLRPVTSATATTSLASSSSSSSLRKATDRESLFTSLLLCLKTSCRRLSSSSAKLGNRRASSECHPYAKLNRRYNLCKCNRMATSCIYFVLVLTILSLRNTSAAFHDNDNITRNHNFNNINSTNTNNNINYNNTNINNNNYNNNIESATQHYSAGILPYNESSASELSSTNKNNNNNYNYSIYQAEKERYKEYPDTDSTLIITETDSEASNTQKNNKSKKKKDKEDNNNVIIQTERQHFGDTDIFGAYSLPDDPIYTNEFAVHIPAGKYVADGIADKYGFINRGQVIIGIDKCDNKAKNKKKKNAPYDEQSLVST